MLGPEPAQSVLPPGSHENRAPAYQAFVIFLSILVTVTVGLRFWSRSLGARQLSGRTISRFWWDDWVALLALISLWVFFAVAFVLVHLGFGRHIWVIAPANLPKLFKFLYTVYFLYDLSLFLTKVSALLFLSRLFPKHANSKLWNYTLWATHALNVAWFLGIILGTVLMCSPVQKGWNPLLPGKCGTTSALWIGSAIPSVLVDFIILLLPVPTIWALRISRTRKAGILIVFILGYSVIVVSLGRMVTVLQSAKALDEDITYEGMPMVYWVTSEGPTTLISICLPPMINLLKRINSSLLSPLSSKISSMWSTYSTNSSSMRSRDGVFTTNLESANGTKDFRQTADQSTLSVPAREGSIQSMGSRSELVNTKSRSLVHDYDDHHHGPQIALTDLASPQEQYVASIGTGPTNRANGRDGNSSQRIRVNRDISITCQPRHGQ